MTQPTEDTIGAAIDRRLRKKLGLAESDPVPDTLDIFVLTKSGDEE